MSAGLRVGDGIIATETGIEIVAGATVTFEALGHAFRDVERQRSRLKWWRGDLMMLAEGLEGEGAWADWIDDGAPRWTLVHELRVARAFPDRAERFGWPLSWSHHYEVLRLPAQQRREVLLMAAMAGGISVRALREALRVAEPERGAAAADSIDPATMPMADYIAARVSERLGRRVDALTVSAVLDARAEWENARDAAFSSAARRPV